LRDEDLKLLHDIERAARLIVDFASGKTESDYSADVFLRSAIERQFEIIGEAVNRLSKANPALAAGIRSYQKIISFRNILIHAYDNVSDEVVWNTIEVDLPLLFEDLQRIHDSNRGADG
jgi:uncharacterized protein with HEPN domain